MGKLIKELSLVQSCDVDLDQESLLTSGYFNNNRKINFLKL